MTTMACVVYTVCRVKYARYFSLENVDIQATILSKACSSELKLHDRHDGSLHGDDV